MTLLRTSDGKRDVLGMLVFAGILLGIVSAVAFRREEPLAPAEEPARKAVMSRSVTFRDDPSGGLAVFDVGADKPFAVVDREKNSFMNTALRLAIRDRDHLGVDRDAAFVITRWDDGRLTFFDPTLNRDLELVAYGSTNAETFGALLVKKGVAR